MKNYQQLKIFIKVLAIFTVFFSATNLIAGKKSDSSIKYPYVHYYDTVYTDTTRNRDGSRYNGGTPINGYRLIDVRVYQPAVGPGSGPPIRVPLQPMVYNGTYPNQPLVSNPIGFQLTHTWANNAPQSGAFPVVLMYGGGGASFINLKMAEVIASAGYIVLVPTGYGLDTPACPSIFCGPAVSRTALRDGRNVITAAENGQLGFNSNQVMKDTNGMTVAACVGGSAGASTCESITAGASINNVNSLPGETNADPRIRAVFAGDSYNLTGTGFNADHFTASLALFGSGLFQNWPRDFNVYHNAAKRIYYDLTNSPHFGADLSSDTTCEFASEYGRIYRDGLNTTSNDATEFYMPFLYLPSGFANCSSAYLQNYRFLPANPTTSGTLAGLLDDTPLTGISYDPGESDFNSMVYYYVVNFLDGILKADSKALTRATTPSYPGLLDNIYVNAVPGNAANNFNLQNLQIDFKPIAGSKHYQTTITPRNGPIADPSTIVGAYSLFGTDSWEDDVGSAITPAFGSFPLINGNLSSTNSIVVNANGYISPESSIGIVDGVYAAKRLNRWFADRGAFTIACLGTDLVGGPGGPDGQIWISNTPERLQITWYQVGSYEFPNNPVSAQCTLFPDGRIRMEYDNSIPAPGVFLGENQDSGSMVIGISNGRLHQNGNGKYNYHRQPKITTLTDVIKGKSTTNADAIFEVYTQGVSAVNAN